MSGNSPLSASEYNRAHYSDVSPGKDEYWNKMAAPRFRVSTLLALIAEQTAGEGRLIDLGCGGGQLLGEIAARFPRLRLSGADIAEPQLALNRQALPDCTFFVADLNEADAVPAELSGTFDLITASEVIEHVERPERLLANAHKLCRPGGRLLLSTQSGPVRATEQRVGHRRHFSVAEMTALLHETGWRARRVWNCGFPFHDLSKWYASRSPDSMIRDFAGGRYGLKQDLICLLLRAAFRFNSRRRGAQLFAVAERSG